MEKTFEELITENHTDKILSGRRIITDYDTLHSLMHQVREATIAEIENKANEYGEIAIADYVSDMPTDRIKLTDENRKGN